MKRTIAALLLLSIVGCLFSCKDNSDKDADRDSDTTIEAVLDNDETEPEEKEETTAEETTAEETTVPETTVEETTVPVTTAPPVTTSPPVMTAPPVTTAPPVVTTSPETEAPKPMTKYPAVLTYHCVLEEPTTADVALFVRPSEFEAQVKAIVDNGIDALFADEFSEVKKDSVIITFDDGYEDNYTHMFPILKKYNVKATIYMIGYKIGKPGYLTAEQIKEMSDSGLVQFGSHTLSHYSLKTLSEDKIIEELAGSRWLISQVTGKPVTTIAYPCGGYDERVKRIAAEYYVFGFTTQVGPYNGQDAMEIPRCFVGRGASPQLILDFAKR